MVEISSNSIARAPSVREDPYGIRSHSHAASKTPTAREIVEKMPFSEYMSYCNNIIEANNDSSVSSSSLILRLAYWHPRFDGEFLPITLRTIRNINPFRFTEVYGEQEKTMDESVRLLNFKRSWVNNYADQLIETYGLTQDDEVKKEIGALFTQQLKGFDEKNVVGSELIPSLKFFIKNFDEFKDFMDPDSIRVMLMKGILVGNHNDREILNEEGGVVARDILDIAVRILEDPNSNHHLKNASYRSLAVGQRDVESADLKSFINSYLVYRVKRFDLSGNEILRVWLQNYDSVDPDQKKREEIRSRYPKFIVDNLWIMEALEIMRPGICRVLFKEFGIHNFARYPLSTLINQYDQRDAEIPYGVLIYPHADHNGGFSNSTMLSQTSKDLSESGFALRIYESGSRFGILKRLASANSRYGEKNKISFAILGGHGAPNEIHLGKKITPEGEETFNLSKRDLKGVSAEEVKDWFVERPSVVLVACSTGDKKGIGKMIYKMGADVSAPNQEATALAIRAGKRTNGSTWFHVQYKEKGVAARFRHRISKE